MHITFILKILTYKLYESQRMTKISCNRPILSQSQSTKIEHMLRRHDVLPIQTALKKNKHNKNGYKIL